jgi:hypothetical protein
MYLFKSIIATVFIFTPTLLAKDFALNSTLSARSPQSAATSSPFGATNGGKPMIDYINRIRRKQGLNPAVWSVKLAENAYKTGEATGGKSMRHKIHPGTNGGQVLAMGFGEQDVCGKQLKGYTSFELYYTSWLCEVSSDKALEGKCPEILKISRVDPRGQTGHYKLLSGKGVRSIGCAFFRNPSAKQCGFPTGIWGCDLGA